MGSGQRGTERQTAQPGARSDPVILEFRYRPPDDDTDSPTETLEQEVAVRRAELARQLNASIYKTGESLTDHRDEEFELTFFCACGCMTEVKRSLRDYVARGALAAGHARPVPRG
jgi:hypothetical protein